MHVSATRNAFNNVFPYAENVCVGGQKWTLARVRIDPWRVRYVASSVWVVPHGERWLYVTKGPKIAIDVRELVVIHL